MAARRSGRTASRRERDLLGELDVPASALYGIHTARALSLTFSGRILRDYPAYLVALAMVKKAAVRANHDARVLDTRLCRAIESACDELIRGEHAEQFPVDLLAGGGEIAVNMNLNEVIANLANQSLGARRGDYAPVHPKLHVNASQSTAEVCHSAARIAILREWIGIEQALKNCASRLRGKSREFRNVITLARTCLRDAEPTSLGDFFSAQAEAVERRARETARSIANLRQINLGGTAIGSGRGAPGIYRQKVIRHLNDISGLKLKARRNLYDAAQNLDDLGQLAAELGLLAEVLIKVASDLRLLSSGPEGGFGEINLPAVMEGSSFFPGKINPTVPETMLQCCYQILGAERAVRLALERGELNLNVFAGAAAANLFDMIGMPGKVLPIFADCVRGISVNRERCAALATRLK